MNNNTLPKISKSKLEKNKNDTWEFLFVFIEEYYDLIYSDPTGEIEKELFPSQYALIAYDILNAQVANGGFIQLIQNGYANYVFDDLFLKVLIDWKMNTIADIVRRAKQIYIVRKEKLEIETTLKEFSKLYEEVKDFESLEDEFYAIMDLEAAKLKEYIANHLEEFAIIED